MSLSSQVTAFLKICHYNLNCLQRSPDERKLVWSQIRLARLAVVKLIPVFPQGSTAIAHLLLYHGKAVRLSLAPEFPLLLCTRNSPAHFLYNNVHHQNASDLELTIQARGQGLHADVTGANTSARTPRRH